MNFYEFLHLVLLLRSLPIDRLEIIKASTFHSYWPIEFPNQKLRMKSRLLLGSPKHHRTTQNPHLEKKEQNISKT